MSVSTSHAAIKKGAVDLLCMLRVVHSLYNAWLLWCKQVYMQEEEERLSCAHHG